MTMKTVAAGCILAKPDEALLVHHGTLPGDAYFRSARIRARSPKLPKNPRESGRIRTYAGACQANTARIRPERACFAIETRKICRFRALI